jgi:phosphate transport system permease protein
LSIELSPILEVSFFGGDMRSWLSNDMGIDFDQRNALVVGAAMGFAVIPTIFSITEDAIFSVPKHLSYGSLALGATQWQTMTRVVLPTASPGIFSAVMIGMGRAVGETMIVLMATGNTPIMDMNIFEGMRTLSANIAVEMPESEVGSTHFRILFLAAFVLFVFTFVVNTIAEYVRQSLRSKYSVI